MLLILIALVAGFFIGCLLDRLVSSIVNFIHEKEKGTEIGAISCAPGPAHAHSLASSTLRVQ